MRVASLIISGLLTVASARPLYRNVKREADSIVAALQTVQTAVQTLDATVASFEGGLGGSGKVFKIQKQTSDVGEAVDAATQTALSHPALDDNESLQVAQSVLRLQAALNSLLPNIASKKPAFDDVLLVFSVSRTVLETLVTQKAQAGALGQAITRLLTPTVASFAPMINAQIAQEFDGAIAVFQEPGGLIPLPSRPSFD